MSCFIELYVNCVYVLLETSKGFSVPIKVRTGIPCSLSKAPNLPSCFFPSFPYCGGCTQESQFTCILPFPQCLTLAPRPDDVRFCGEETHSHGLSLCALSPLMCLHVFLLPVSPPLPTFRTHLQNFCFLRAPWVHSPFNPSGPFWSLSCVFLPSG